MIYLLRLFAYFEGCKSALEVISMANMTTIEFTAPWCLEDWQSLDNRIPMAFDNQLAARAKDKNSRKNDYHRWLSNRRNRFIEAGGFKIKHRIRKKFFMVIRSSEQTSQKCLWKKRGEEKKCFVGAKKRKLRRCSFEIFYIFMRCRDFWVANMELR